MIYLLRRGAQNEAAKPNGSFNNETGCKTITHAPNYTNKILYCNIILLIFAVSIQKTGNFEKKI